MMSSSDNSPLNPRARSELKRRYFHKGYLWPWILVLLVPFVLRFVMFYDVTFPFKSSPSATEVVRPEELQLYRFSESSPDDVKITLAHGTGVVRPGVGARTTHGDGSKNANDRMKNDPSHGRTENEVPVTKKPDDQDTVDVNLEFSEENEEDNVEGVVDEVQLRQIGERIQAIKRWENWEERSRWNREQEVTNDELEAEQINDEQKDNEEEEELKATQEKLASEERKPPDIDEEMAVEEIMVVAEMEAEEDRKVIRELEASDLTRKDARGQKAAEKRRASKQKVANAVRKDAGKNDEKAAAKEMNVDGDRRVSDKSEAAEERRDVLGWEAAVKADAEEEKEAEEERRAAEERDAEEELMAAKERAAEMKNIAAQENEADHQRKIEEERDAEEERTVDDQREAGEEKKSEAEKSSEDKREGNESDDVERNQDAKQTELEEKNSSEVVQQKTTSHQNEDGRTVKLEEPTDEGKHTEDQNQENENKEKHQDSDQKDQEDLTTPSDQTQPASLAAGECDLFDGDWEYDPEGPLYTNSTCFYIRGDHNCMSNGRADTDYLHWRWKPRGCDLPRFDARAFMEAFRGKTIGFIGDSLARNQMQSMLCMLSLVEVPIQTHYDPLTSRWLYEQHQVTLAVAWSPYLLKESQEGVMGFEKGQSVLFLDVLDPLWTSMLPDCDILVLSVGQWYFKPSVYVMQGEVIGCHYCPNLNITQLDFPQAYSEGLRRALEKVAEDYKGIAILSTFASAHGERSPGDEKEQCRRERPLDRKEWESSFRGMQKEMREIVVGEFNRMVNDKSKLNNDMHLEFLDVSTLSLLRPDGHPGPYYLAHPYEGKSPDEWVSNDCLHWCLPGPVDTWNHLLVKIAHKHL